MNSDELKRRLSVNIKKIRKAKNLSQFELAEKANLSDQAIKNIAEKSIVISELKDALKKNVDYLIEEFFKSYL